MRWPWDRPTVEQTSSFLSPMYIKIWERHFTAFAVSQKKNNLVWVSIQVRFEKGVGQEEKKKRTLQTLSKQLLRNVWRSCIYPELNAISLMLLTHPGQLAGNSHDHSVPVSSASSWSKNIGQPVALECTPEEKSTLLKCISKRLQTENKICIKTVYLSCFHNIAELCSKP